MKILLKYFHMLQIFGSVIYIYLFIIAFVLFFLGDTTGGIYFNLSIIVYSLLLLPFHNSLQKGFLSKDILILLVLGILLSHTNNSYFSLVYLIFSVFFIFFSLDFFRFLGLGVFFLFMSFSLGLVGFNVDPSINNMGFILIALGIVNYVYELVLGNKDILAKYKFKNVFPYFFFSGFILVLIELYFSTNYNIQVIFALFLVLFSVLKKYETSKSVSLNIDVLFNNGNIVKSSILYFGLFMLIFIPFVRNTGEFNQNHSYIFLGLVVFIYSTFIFYFRFFEKKINGKILPKIAYLGITLIIASIYLSVLLIQEVQEEKVVDEIPFEFEVVDEVINQDNTTIEVENFLKEIDQSEEK